MQKDIANGVMLGSPFGPQYGTNNPYNCDTQTQYYAQRTKMFNAERLPWASNVVSAQIQGLNYSDFYTYATVNIRTANLIDPTTGLNLGSDWQRIICLDMNVDFLPRGAKVVFNGNVWLVINPMNVQSITGTSVIRRCNALWNYLDEDGNVQSEPFCFGQGAYDLATTDYVQEQMILMKGYQHCVMQLNQATSVLKQNYRMILGNNAYSVRGVQNFVLEFSQDASSTHIQYFDLQITEPLESDDMVNKVAGGLDVADTEPGPNNPTPQGPAVYWTQTPPEAIEAYGSATLTAAYAENGAATSDLVTFSFDGPNDQSYTSIVNENTASIQCWRYDPEPLVVTASCNGQSVSAQIQLEGR